MTRRGFVLGLAATVIVQVLLLGAMLWNRVMTIRSGQEVILESRFVDPRDLFRGHYVRLNLTPGPIDSEIPGTALDFQYNDPVIISLKPGKDGFWVAKAVFKEFPKETSDPVLEGTFIGNSTVENGFRVRFPFDRYFAPKKRAQELENLPSDKKLGVILALDGKGSGVIKGITVGSDVIYDEPLL